MRDNQNTSTKYKQKTEERNILMEQPTFWEVAECFLEFLLKIYLGKSVPLSYSYQR